MVSRLSVRQLYKLVFNIIINLYLQKAAKHFDKYVLVQIGIL